MNSKPEFSEIPTGADDRHSPDDSDLSLIQRAVAAGLVAQEDAGRVWGEISSGGPLTEPLRDSGVTKSSVTETTEESHAGQDSAAQAGPANEAAAAIELTASWGLAGLPERYQIERLIGQGGMGAVYAAFDRQLHRRVAVKVLKDGRYRALRGKMMLRECQVLAALEDPGIVSVFDAGTLDDGSPYFIMRCVEGHNLDEYMSERKLDWRGVLDLVARICDAAHRAHLLRIVHRDLKPKNIKITADGAPVILDFGLAKAVGEASSVAEPAAAPTRSPAGDDSPHVDASLRDAGSPRPGETGPLFSDARLNFETLGGGGTAGYMSPEQAAGEPVDQRTDVYALGVVLYQLLSGHLPSAMDEAPVGRPFRADETAWKGRPTLTSLRSIPPHVPRDVAAIIERCLESDRQQRYPDCAALAANLRRAVAGDTVSIYATGHPWYRLRKFVRRHRVSVIAGAAVMIALAMAAVSGLLSWKNKIEMDARLASQQREAELQHEADQELAIRKQEAQDTLLQRTHTDAAARFLGDQEYTLAYEGPGVGSTLDTRQVTSSMRAYTTSSHDQFEWNSLTRPEAATKSESRNPKSETNSKLEIQMF